MRVGERIRSGKFVLRRGGAVSRIVDRCGLAREAGVSIKPGARAPGSEFNKRD